MFYHIKIGKILITNSCSSRDTMVKERTTLVSCKLYPNFKGEDYYYIKKSFIIIKKCFIILKYFKPKGKILITNSCSSRDTLVKIRTTLVSISHNPLKIL